jgi:rubrerythrin
MDRMGEYEWFCAVCLRLVDGLSRQGRCPYCDSNTVTATPWMWPTDGTAQE